MGWNELAAAQHGVIARDQLRSSGCYDRAITRLLERRLLWPVHEGVFLVRGAPLTYAARAWAAVMSTNGIIGFDTAGYLWEQVSRRPDRVHVCVEHPTRSRPPEWVALHRVPAPTWARTTRGGLPITSASWTLLDLVSSARRETDASALLDRGLQQGWITAASVDRRLKSCPGRYGNGRLRRLQDQLADGAAAKSERLLHQILRRGGVTGWRPNFPIVLNGQRRKADVAFPAWRLVIEVDGWAHHSDVERFRGDRHRQNDLVAAGWTVLRFTWSDLTERPDYVLATIQNFGAQMDAR